MWRAWTLSATLGEFAGFCVPALVAALALPTAPAAAALALIAAGAVEGMLLGWSQARVLAGAVPGVRRGRWIAATAAAAAVAWTIGSVPMITDGAVFSMPRGVLIAVTAGAAAALLGSIGTAQWFVLRPHIPRSAWWIPTTAASWAAGLTVFAVVTTPLWQPGQPGWLVAAIGVLGGLLMAGTVAALTGWALLSLVRRSPTHPRDTHPQQAGADPCSPVT